MLEKDLFSIQILPPYCRKFSSSVAYCLRFYWLTNTYFKRQLILLGLLFTIIVVDWLISSLKKEKGSLICSICWHPIQPVVSECLSHLQQACTSQFQHTITTAASPWNNSRRLLLYYHLVENSSLQNWEICWRKKVGKVIFFSFGEQLGSWVCGKTTKINCIYLTVMSVLDLCLAPAWKWIF